MENKIIELDGVQIPYIINDEGIEFYPIKYLFEKVLLKARIQMHKKKKYITNVRKYIIDFEFLGTSKQECLCVNKAGLIDFSKSIKTSRLSELQAKRHDLLCEMIGSQFKFIDRSEVDNYDEYIIDCINVFKDVNVDAHENTCLICKRKFPLHANFFPQDNRSNKGYLNTCKMCIPNYYPIIHSDIDARRVYTQFGINGYLLYKNDKFKFIREYCNDNFIIKLDAVGDKKDELLKFLLSEYKSNNISRQDLNVRYMRNNYYINNGNLLGNGELVEYLSEGDSRVRPWLYDGYAPENVSYEEANIIVETYIRENLQIDNIFTYGGYQDMLTKCKISKYKQNILYFIVQYYKFKYPGYMFTLKSVNYYKDINMRIFDMKYFIEKDMMVDIMKIPLYITKYSLHKIKPLYHIMNIYYKNLFEWINECYPDIFNINDFVNNPFRSEFDSMEEAQIDEQLRIYFKGTIYNCRSKEDYIMIDGMIPDWVIPTNKGCYLVEYFGMYSDGNIESSSRLKKYKEKTDIKIGKYIKLEEVGYKHLFIFREDIKNNFLNLKTKLDNIK